MIPKYQRYRVGQRWLVALGLLSCVVFHLTVIARFLLSPAQFRARTQLLLQERFKGEVTVGEAGYAFPSGFRLADLCVSRPAARGGGPMFQVRALSVDISLLALLRGKVAVDEVLLVEPEVRVTKEDLAELGQTQAAEPGEPLGRIVIRGGRLAAGNDVLFEGSPERELRDVRIELSQERRLNCGYTFEGEAKSALWGRCDLEGTLDLGGRRLDARAVARGISIDSRLRELLPKEHKKYADALDRYNLSGVADLSLEATMSWGENKSIALRAAADLRGCSAAWERFPVRCTDIRGKVVFDGANLYYQDLTGRAGPATITLTGQTTGEKVEVHMVGRGRPLDRELHDAAPETLKRVWDRCGIESGIINVDYQSTWWRADQRYEASIRSEVRDVRATYSLFPYPLGEVSGTVRWENGVSYIDSLRGRRGHARVQVRGQVTDTGAPDLVIEASDVPFDDTLRGALTPGWRKIFEELQPEGTAGVHCTLTSPDGDPKKLQYRFTIRPEGASFQHKSFPHRITDVRGEVLVDEAGTVSFRDLRGRLGSIPLQFLGTVRPGEKEPVLDLTVVAPEVELGPAARSFVSKQWGMIYDDLSPSGKVRFTWHLSTDPASGGLRQSTEITCLQDCSVEHRLLPVRVTGLMGRVLVDEAGQTTFTGMKGRVGNATVEAVVGRCAPGGVGGLSFTLRVTGLALTEEIRKALPVSWQKVWDEVRPSGEAAVEYQFIGNPQAPERPQQRVVVEPTDGAFSYTRFPLPVRELTRGKVVFDQEGNTTISGLQGKVRDKAVQLTGKVTMGPDGGLMHLEVAADEVALDQELQRALPPEWQEVLRDLRVGGSMAAKALADIRMAKGEWLSFRLDATLKGCEATWSGLPVRLTGLRGRLEYADGLVTLTDVLGECAVADQVKLNGRIPKKGVEGGRLQVVVQNARVVPELLAALPEGLRKMLETLAFKGSADADLTLAPAEKGIAAMQCFGTLRLRDCSFRKTHDFEQISGNLRIDSGLIHEDGRQVLAGGLDLRKLVAHKYVVTELKGGFAYQRAPTGEGKPMASRLVLSDLVGSFYGGSVTARVAMDVDGAGAFASRLAVDRADFRVFAKEALQVDTPATGRMSWQVEFPPGRYKEENLVGDGEASITEGELGQLPLTASLFNALSLRSPLDRSITEAKARFGIAKDALVLKEMYLLGEARVLAGQGTAGFDGSLNIRLVSPRAERTLWDVIMIVPNLIREQLVQVEVRGTLSQPEVRVLPVPVIPQLVETFTDALGIWRKRHPEKSSPPPPAPAPLPPAGP